MNHSPLKRKTPLRTGGILDRKGRPSHRTKLILSDDPNDPEIVWREDIRRRSGGWCERCAALGRRRRAVNAHHRRTRQEKWSRWIVNNGIDLCGDCHHVDVHGHPEWARNHGLILSRHSRAHPRPVLGCGLDCDVDHYA
jgi:hypothetical protein